MAERSAATPASPVKSSPTAVCLQRKMTVNSPGDIYEQEADRVAEQVMRMPESHVQRECLPARHASGTSVDRAPSSTTGGSDAPAIVGQVLNSPGSPLPKSTQTSMESRFCQDFGHVRVHTNHDAAESAAAVHARAYTVGNNIVFGRGEDPARDHRLVAHELTHVLQQTSGVSHGHSLQNEQLQRMGDSPEQRTKTLLDYVSKLETTGQIEDEFSSDVRARDVIARWDRGDSEFILPVKIKILLVRELLSGATLDADEIAILTLLRQSTDVDRQEIVNQVGASRLDEDIHGDENTQLQSLVGKTHGTTTPNGFETGKVRGAQQRFTQNAMEHHPHDCITVLREQLPSLYEASGQNNAVVKAAGKQTKMTDLGDAMQKIGMVDQRKEVTFKPDNGNTRPTSANGSVWDTILGMVGDQQGWHVFGLAVFNGYHSVTIVVERRPDIADTKVYWADQKGGDQKNRGQEIGSAPGFRRYEKAGMDNYIELATQTWWDDEHSKGRKWNATTIVYKFNSGR